MNQYRVLKAHQNQYRIKFDGIQEFPNARNTADEFVLNMDGSKIEDSLTRRNIEIERQDKTKKFKIP